MYIIYTTGTERSVNAIAHLIWLNSLYSASENCFVYSSGYYISRIECFALLIRPDSVGFINISILSMTCLCYCAHLFHLFVLSWIDMFIKSIWSFLFHMQLKWKSSEFLVGNWMRCWCIVCFNVQTLMRSLLKEFLDIAKWYRRSLILMKGCNAFHLIARGWYGWNFLNLYWV